MFHECSRAQRLICPSGALLVCLAISTVRSPLAGDDPARWIDGDELVRETLILAPGERERLVTLEQEGLLTVRPVALPRGKYLHGENRHLGWPVGARVGKTLLCAYHRTLRHHGGRRSGPMTSEAVVVRSGDGGASWSDDVDLREVGVNDTPCVLGFGNCFGVLDKTVFLATTYGLYRSDDEGLTWTLVPGALTQEKTGFPGRGGFGPRMVIHPTRGLVIPVGARDEPVIDMFWSRDRGRTWKHERHSLPDGIHPLEPTALWHDGHLIFLTRNHALPFRWHRDLREPQRPAMVVSSTGWLPPEHAAITPISSFRWPDTTDLDFNPVTRRYEAVVTNRSGGGPVSERNEDGEQTVNLWSIARADAHAGLLGRWRFEGTLLRLRSGMRDITPDDVDAAHPGGAVMDTTREVQHVFVYCGRFRVPAGVYRITRTLDTTRLARALARLEEARRSPDTPPADSR